MFQPPVGCSSSARELVMLVRAEILSATPPPPASRAAPILQLIHRGSLHANNSNTDNETELREREEFARTCFETLLQFSMLEDISSLVGTHDASDPLAVVALLQRFQDVIVKYSQDNLMPEPLSKHQLSEISFVLKALATLTESMKKAPPGKVDTTAWHKLIGVYPDLVRLSSSPPAIEASAALREALLQYSDLLSPPL